MPKKNHHVELTPAQLWELVCGFSVHPDRSAFVDDEEMRQAWRDHEDQVRDWQRQYYPESDIWIETHVGH